MASSLLGWIDIRTNNKVFDEMRQFTAQIIFPVMCIVLIIHKKGSFIA